MIYKSAIIATYLLGFASSSDEILRKSSSNLRRQLGNGKNGKNGNGNGKKMNAPCTLLLRASDFKGNQKKQDNFEWFCELDPADNNGKKGHIVPFSEKKKFKRNQKIPGGGRFESGITTLHGNITIKNGKVFINGNPQFGRRNNNNANRSGRHLSETNKTVLVIRVEANDGSTTSSAAKTAEEIFGIGGNDEFNLASGYTGCSYGELNFLPATHSGVNNGVYTMVLNESLASKSMSYVEGRVVDAAVDVFGGDLLSKFDYVMICTPPLADDGIAYAYVNSWLSVYHDDWCNYPSAQIHELGHNLGLAHSNEATPYDDQSGMMGYSYANDEGPRMCFNNAKNWQLGWYSDKHATATPLTSSWSGNLVGVADYSEASGTDTVVLKVEGNALDYYVGFNRKAGINSGTNEGGNQVTIQERDQGTGYAPSKLIAKLSSGNEHTIPDFGSSGRDVVIKVTSIDTTANPPKATVEVFQIGGCSNDSDCDDGSPCTDDVCNSNGLCSSISNGSCSDNSLTVDITTDWYPSETSWEVVDNCNGDTVVLSGGSYSSGFTTFSKTANNLLPSQYSFIIKDAYGDGVCCAYGEGEYVVKQNGVIVAEGGEFASVDTKTWGSCPGNSITVEITTDWYPSETSWEVVDNCNGDTVVLSGGSYSSGFTTFSKTANNLLPSQYSFIIKDAYGDGVCCDYGEGEYVVKQNGVIVAEGGEFASVDTKTWGSC